MYRIGKYSSARFARDATVFLATSLLTLGLAVWAVAQPASTTPQTQTLPANPTGGGPTSGEPAPAPPEEQRVILPSASGHINSAAPTMQTTCPPVSPERPGTATPPAANDPCMRDATPADQQRRPEMSK